MRAFLHRMKESQKGATAIEYGLIISLIVLAMMVALTNVATKTSRMWSNIANDVSNH